jgi:hypothetical protein
LLAETNYDGQNPHDRVGEIRSDLPGLYKQVELA